MIKEIKWKWLLLKTRLGLSKIDYMDKYMKKNYCRFGIHNIRNSNISFGGLGQRMKHIKFIRCKHCKYLFFAKKSDKERYEKYQEKTKGTYSALFTSPSSGKLEHRKPSVDK